MKNHDTSYQEGLEISIGSAKEISHFTGMQIIDRLDHSVLHKFHGGAVTMGNFDGLHLGHQALLKVVAGLPGPKTVLTFDPHPLQVLYPQKGLRRLFPREDLAEQLPRYGMEALVILPFDRTFAEQTASRFLRERIEQPLRPKHFVAGYDLAFGKDRQGSLTSLKEWAAPLGIEVHVVPAFELDGEIVSSRRIRDLVARGRVDQAARLLGRPFYLRGEVIRGAGRGATIGIPTLNQKVENETLPAQGVYATRTRYGGKVFPSVTNIGLNPTFGGENEVKVETHVLSGPFEGRGLRLDVDFIERLRPEMKFPSIEDLKKQIQNDILKARSILGMK